MDLFASAFDFLNPLKHFSQSEYVGLWKDLFNTFLAGFWGRLFASFSLALAFWCGMVRQKLPLAIVFFGLTLIFAYCGGAMKFVFWWLY